MVNLGATWVHGRGTNPLYSLVQEYNVSYFAVDYDDYMVRNKTGYNITDDSDAVYEDKFEPAMEAFEDTVKQQGKTTDQTSRYVLVY